MSSSFKNIIALLLVLTFGYLGYYLFVQNKDSQILTVQNKHVDEKIVQKTDAFIERKKILDKVEIDTDIFDNSLFISYKNFKRPIQTTEFGRENPFNKTDVRIIDIVDTIEVSNF